MDLGQFFIQQADEFVVLFDRFHGLDEDGLSAGAGAVHHTLHPAFLLDFDGMTKRSPRIVISSSCTAPPSASRCR